MRDFLVLVLRAFLNILFSVVKIESFNQLACFSSEQGFAVYVNWRDEYAHAS